MNPRKLSGKITLMPKAIVEEKTEYKEQIGSCHFITQFSDVIFRCRGSVLPKIVAELTISFALGWFAYLLHHHPFFESWEAETAMGLVSFTRGHRNNHSSADDDRDTFVNDSSSVDGHSLFGFLLGFLIVFRTQSGFNFMLEGHEHLSMLNRTLRNIAIELLGSIPPSGLTEAQAQLVLSCQRRLKLYYYTVIEHLRSNDSMKSWLEAHAMVLRFATDAEVEELELEFGSPTPKRKAVRVPTDIVADAVSSITLADSQGPSRDVSPTCQQRRMSTAQHASRNEAIRRCSVLMDQPSRKVLVSGAPAPDSTSDSTSPGSLRRPSPGSPSSSGSFQTKCCSSFTGSFAKRSSTAKLSNLPAQPPSPAGNRSSQRSSTRGSSLGTKEPRHRHSSHSFVKPRNQLATFSIKDPTHSKPMYVALHLRRDLQQLGQLGMIGEMQVAAFSARVDDMISAYLGMNKIDKLCLPLPYSQLLKIFSIFFVFTVSGRWAMGGWRLAVGGGRWAVGGGR